VGVLLKVRVVVEAGGVFRTFPLWGYERDLGVVQYLGLSVGILEEYR